MRIRSIKPEFWRSADISSLEWESRLLFIGLWSYVDDNGVGQDKLSAITADLFADDLERDSSETFARVSRGLQNLSEAGRIVRYTVEGKDFLEVVNWGKHQRIDKPNKARYDRHDAEFAVIRETLATPSRGSSDRNRGTGEQGSRGAGEKKPAQPPADAAEPDPAQQATKNAYDRVGKAFKYVAVLAIAKWAIKERGTDPGYLADAFVNIYGMGKPITRQVVGQYLDGKLNQPQQRMDHSARGLAKGTAMLAAFDARNSEPTFELEA